MKSHSRALPLMLLLAAGKPASADLGTVHEAILKDFVESYQDYQAPLCSSTPATDGATTTTFEYPGINPGSNWYEPFENYEQDLFLASMTHTDSNDLSWTIRIGKGGNIYSHYVPDLYGETIPPQAHKNAPWIDEVTQLVSVNTNLNYNSQYNSINPNGREYYIHQAGAYQNATSPDTNVNPFFSPNLAKHCDGSTCYFASWGTSAWIPTHFISPIMYINRYTNCGDGTIEFTQMIHNFADPGTSEPINVDHTYFNVPWSGVRPSNLPLALEPNPTNGTLNYMNPSNVDYLPICNWGDDAQSNPDAGRGARRNIKNLQGYTTFVGSGLEIDRPVSEVKTWCRQPEGCDSSNVATCMKADCTDEEIANGWTRIELKVPAAGPNCSFHTNAWLGKVGIQCNLRAETGFGQTTPYLTGEECHPWNGIEFVNSYSGESLDIAFIRHWSWGLTNKKVYFAVDVDDDGGTFRNEAIARANEVFANPTGSPININIVIKNQFDGTPPGYNPAALPAFTFVYGDGNDYTSKSATTDCIANLCGVGRRRIGSGSRDFTVFTLNWWNGALLEAGASYANRQYIFSSRLGDVEAKANSLKNSVDIAKVYFEEWNPRSIDIYKSNDGTVFDVVSAASSQGASTSCSNSGATRVCTGYSTPQAGHAPFFYIECGSNNYLGPDPYQFSPDFTDGSIWGHGRTKDTVIESWICANQGTTRPTWTLMGFFSLDSCSSLDMVNYEPSLCDATVVPSMQSSASPSVIASSPPSVEASSSPSVTASSPPSVEASSSPSVIASSPPSVEASSSPSVTASSPPSVEASSSPSVTPSTLPSMMASSSPSVIVSSSPSVGQTGTCDVLGTICKSDSDCEQTSNMCTVGGNSCSSDADCKVCSIVKDGQPCSVDRDCKEKKNIGICSPDASVSTCQTQVITYTCNFDGNPPTQTYYTCSRKEPNAGDFCGAPSTDADCNADNIGASCGNGRKACFVITC